jgi:hypothetical protein
VAQAIGLGKRYGSKAAAKPVALARRGPHLRAMRRAFLAFLLLIAAPAYGQQPARGIPELAAEPMREAMRLLETVKSSNLEPGWRANAAARAARALARAGDGQAARARAQEAELAVSEETRTRPIDALSEGAIYALLSQVYAELRDAEVCGRLAAAAMPAIARLGDPGVRASLFATVAQALAQIGQADAAGEAVLQSLRSASVTPAGRERVAALASLILAQARLGQVEEARAVMEAARQSLEALTQPVERTNALASLARAEAALGARPAAQALAREAATNYARAETELSDIQRAVSLGLIALAQNESGDRATAQSTLRNARQAADAVSRTYDRLQAMLAFVDTVLQIQ